MSLLCGKQEWPLPLCRFSLSPGMWAGGGRTKLQDLGLKQVSSPDVNAELSNEEEADTLMTPGKLLQVTAEGVGSEP